MKAQIGSISHGTMCPQDIIPVFAATLAELDNGDIYTEIISQAMNIDWEDWDYCNNEVPYIEESLFDALNYYAPLDCYFGSHPGDGSDYGFWKCED